MSIYFAPESFASKSFTIFALSTATLGATFALFGPGDNPSLAQSITPSGDTNTQITQVGQRYDIQGSTLSADGKNLFHSLNQFGLSPSEIANFISAPDIDNILTRVVGGNASFIDGVIQATGGDANLYLMNPAGLFFGENASLNVPADFTATTATGIGFGSEWFSAVGTNTYAALVGTPDRLGFNLIRPGAIVNEGELMVGGGDRLTLIGGTVVNTGTLATEGGQITLAAVPEDNIVRLSQANQLLNLEFQTLDPTMPVDALPNALPFVPATLPTLLTGGSATGATDVMVNADGSISLTGSDVAVSPTPGTMITTGVIDASNVSSDIALSESAPPESTVEGIVGGRVQVLGDRVALLNATVDASGTDGGGTVWLGGEFQGQGITLTASRTLVDTNSVVTVDALETGNGGEAIVWADDVTGFYGDIAARGGAVSGDGGFVEISGYRQLNFSGTVDTSAVNGIAGTVLFDPTDISIFSTQTGSDDDQVTDGRILAGDVNGTNDFFRISVQALEALSGNTNILLSASEDISVSDSVAFKTQSGQSVNFIAGEEFYLGLSSTLSTEGGNINIFASDIDVAGILNSKGGDIFLSGQVDTSFTTQITSTGITDGNITFNGNINGFSLPIDAGNGQVRFNGESNQLLVDADITGNTIFSGGEFYAPGDTTINGTVTLEGDLNLGRFGSDRIVVNGSIDGSHNLTIDGREVSLNGDIGSNVPLSSLDVTGFFGDIRLGGDIITDQGLVTLGFESITLTQDTIISTGLGEGNIEVQGALLSADTGPHSLTLNAGSGNISIDKVGIDEASTLENRIDNLSISGNTIEFDDILTQGNVFLTSISDLNLGSDQILAGGDVELISQVSVNIDDWIGTDGEAIVDAGGNLFVQGNDGVRINAINNRQSRIQSGGMTTLVSDGLIEGNSRFINNGFSVLNLAGENGDYTSNSQSLISSLGDVDFGDYRGPALKVEAVGSITGGDIEITSANGTFEGDDPDFVTLASGSALILRAGETVLQNPVISGQTQIGDTIFNRSNTPSVPATINLGSIKTETTDGFVILSAPGDINTGSIDADPLGIGTEIADAAVEIISGGDITVGDRLTQSFDERSIRGVSVRLAAVGDINAGNIFSNTSNNSENPGANLVRLSSTTGDITVGYILAGQGGIDIDAGGSLQALNARDSSSNRTFDAPPILADYLADLGYPDDSFEDQIFLGNFLVSLESIDGPISIKYGQNREPIIDPVTTESGFVLIEIEGDPEQELIVGPDYDETNPFLISNDPFPSSDDEPIPPFDETAEDTFPFADLVANATPLDALPEKASGAVGGISSTATDASLQGSLQNRLFEPEPPPPVDDPMADNPTDIPIDNPVINDPIAENPIDIPTDDPVAENPIDTPTDDSFAETPGDTPTDELVAENPGDTPTDNPVAETPDDAPDDPVAENPGENDDTNPAAEDSSDDTLVAGEKIGEENEDSTLEDSSPSEFSDQEFLAEAVFDSCDAEGDRLIRTTSNAILTIEEALIANYRSSSEDLIDPCSTGQQRGEPELESNVAEPLTVE
ncbi:MAG: filamentous hemagglutinin N-terminal domain-containing protein [Cyanobacteria bacterium P01_F01_bin.150]